MRRLITAVLAMLLAVPAPVLLVGVAAVGTVGLSSCGSDSTRKTPPKVAEVVVTSEPAVYLYNGKRCYRDEVEQALIALSADRDPITSTSRARVRLIIGHGADMGEVDRLLNWCRDQGLDKVVVGGR